jgi:hypothetical protein
MAIVEARRSDESEWFVRRCTGCRRLARLLADGEAKGGSVPSAGGSIGSPAG